MQRTIKIKLGKDESLLETIRLGSEIYAYIVKVGLKNKTYNKNKIHNLTYAKLRKKYPQIPSGLLQTMRDVACEALKRTKLKKKIRVGEYSSLRLDKRNLRVNLEHKLISISSIEGRKKLTFNTNPIIEKYSDWSPVAGTLSYRKGNLFLNLVVEKVNPQSISGGNVLGIDRGINNILVCSNNQFFNSKHLKEVKGRYRHLKSRLQSKGTASSRRRLKKISGAEKRFVSDMNHRLSKAIANSDYSVFAVEDLRDMKKKSNGRRFNRKLGSWSFKQFETLLTYKSEALGKQVIKVNPRNTSRTCSKCNNVDKLNRSGSKFKCRNCGFELHADLNASRNIANLGITEISRLNVNEPIVTQSAVTSHSF
jgi:IS605 OrfB family transposase